VTACAGSEIWKKEIIVPSGELEIHFQIDFGKLPMTGRNYSVIRA
jgi:hypothetical protein